MTPQRVYMPSQIQHQMQHELERSLPADLRQFASGEKYIPQHAQAAMLQHIERSMPSHLKEYAKEFMRQQSMAGAQTIHPTQAQEVQHINPAHAANPMRRDHSLGFGQQYTVDVDNPSGSASQGSLAYTAQYQGTSSTGAAPTASPPGQYDFITNYNHQQRGGWLVTASLKTRIAIVGGGLIVLLLVTWIGVSLFNASSTAGLQNLSAIASEQAELVRVANAPAKSAKLQATQNLAATISLTTASDEQRFLSYLKNAGASPSDSQLASGTNAQTDQQLSSAKAAGTYDQTYVQMAQTALTKYAGNLKRAFNATSNANERTLLNSAYTHAQLLLKLAQQA